MLFFVVFFLSLPIAWEYLSFLGISVQFSSNVLFKYLNTLQNCPCWMLILFRTVLEWQNCPCERLLLSHKKAPGFLASRGEEFNLGPETRLDHSELLCDKVLLKYKGDRESFWHRHQKGAESVSVSNGVIHSPISHYNESKEWLEVVKTLLDPLP